MKRRNRPPPLDIGRDRKVPRQDGAPAQKPLRDRTNRWLYGKNGDEAPNFHSIDSPTLRLQEAVAEEARHLPSQGALSLYDDVDLANSPSPLNWLPNSKTNRHGSHADDASPRASVPAPLSSSLLPQPLNWTKHKHQHVLGETQARQESIPMGNDAQSSEICRLLNDLGGLMRVSTLFKKSNEVVGQWFTNMFQLGVMRMGVDVVIQSEELKYMSNKPGAIQYLRVQVAKAQEEMAKHGAFDKASVLQQRTMTERPWLTFSQMREAYLNERQAFTESPWIANNISISALRFRQIQSAFVLGAGSDLQWNTNSHCVPEFDTSFWSRKMKVETMLCTFEGLVSDSIVNQRISYTLLQAMLIRCPRRQFMIYGNYWNSFSPKFHTTQDAQDRELGRYEYSDTAYPLPKVGGTRTLDAEIDQSTDNDWGMRVVQRKLEIWMFGDSIPNALRPRPPFEDIQAQTQLHFLVRPHGKRLARLRRGNHLVVWWGHN